MDVAVFFLVVFIEAWVTQIGLVSSSSKRFFEKPQSDASSEGVFSEGFPDVYVEASPPTTTYSFSFGC